MTAARYEQRSLTINSHVVDRFCISVHFVNPYEVHRDNDLSEAVTTGKGQEIRFQNVGTAS